LIERKGEHDKKLKEKSEMRNMRKDGEEMKGIE